MGHGRGGVISRSGSPEGGCRQACHNFLIQQVVMTVDIHKGGVRRPGGHDGETEKSVKSIGKR